jgi:uncharacterized protein YegJ (DUF2314 family)
MGRGILLAVALGAAVLAGSCNAQPSDEVVNYDASDSAMLKAIKDANATLPQFWRWLDRHPEHASFASLKVGLKVEGGGSEHIWFGDLRRDGSTVYGRAQNRPAYIANLQQGDEIQIDLSAISDWSIETDDKIYGNYTTRVMLETADAPEAESLRTRMAVPPVPSEP